MEDFYRDFLSEPTKNKPPLELEILTDDLETSVLSLPKIPPELLMEDFVQGTSVWRLMADQCTACANSQTG